MVRSRSSNVCLTAWMARAALCLVAPFAARGRREAGGSGCVRNGSMLNRKRSFPADLAIIFSILALLLFAPDLQAQKNDWRGVEMLEPGSWLHVKAQRKYFCVLEGVAHDELICEVHKRRSFATTTIAIPRSEVREVRKVPNLDDQRRDGWVGAGVGAAAGAIAAGSAARTYRGANAFFGGLAGAGVGYIAGEFIPLFQMRGKLIYKR